ncbi:IS630 family transposase [Candidatus Brocadia pituitae]|nr:IS630 family transposase [Candidatus Brocadia pituitae]
MSTDPEFTTKAADIVGLYLSPPENVIVISVDEKPSIQALERTKGYVCTSNRKIVHGLKSTYKRHGTLNLFAALNVATGTIHTQTTELKRRVEFLAFMDQLLLDLPDSDKKEIHVILDNYCIHKRNGEWLAAHPNVKFHFTPTSASWLNQVEIWFGILSRKALKNASFKSVEQLRCAIEAFIEAYQPNAKPLVWRKRDAIINLPKVYQFIRGDIVLPFGGVVSLEIADLCYRFVFAFYPRNLCADEFLFQCNGFCRGGWGCIIRPIPALRVQVCNLITIYQATYLIHNHSNIYAVCPT